MFISYTLSPMVLNNDWWELVYKYPSYFSPHDGITLGKVLCIVSQISLAHQISNLREHQSQLQCLLDQMDGTTCRVSDSGHLEWDLRICIPNQCPGDADAGQPWTIFWESVLAPGLTMMSCFLAYPSLVTSLPSIPLLSYQCFWDHPAVKQFVPNSNLGVCFLGTQNKRTTI